MKHSLKLTTIFIAIIVVIGLLLAVILIKPQKQPAESEKHQPEVKDQQQPTAKKLSLKEQTEKNIIETKGAGYTRFSLEEGGEKNFIVDYFPPEHYFIPETKEHDGGIMVFKINNDGSVEKFWESIDENIVLTRPVISVRDITGDGKTEILALWSDGNKIDALYVYSWTGDNFKLITPLTSFTSPSSGRIISGPSFGSYDGGVKVKDLDGDKIEEVVIIKTQYLEDDPETLKPKEEYYRRIYKWDLQKQEYYLWKEEKIGEEKPEPIE